MPEIQAIGLVKSIYIDLWNLPNSGLSTVSGGLDTNGKSNILTGLRGIPITETFINDPDTPTTPILSQGTEQTPLIIINYTTRVVEVVNVSATNSDYFYSVIETITAKGDTEATIAGLASKNANVFDTHDAIIILDMINNPKKWAFVTVKNVEIFVRELIVKKAGVKSDDYPNILTEQQNLVWASLSETDKVLYVLYFQKWGVRQSVDIPKVPILAPTYPVTVTPPASPVLDPPTTGVGSGTGGVVTPETQKTITEKIKDWLTKNKKSLTIGGGVVAGVVVLTQIVPKNEK